MNSPRIADRWLCLSYPNAKKRSEYVDDATLQSKATSLISLYMYTFILSKFSVFSRQITHLKLLFSSYLKRCFSYHLILYHSFHSSVSSTPFISLIYHHTQVGWWGARHTLCDTQALPVLRSFYRGDYGPHSQQERSTTRPCVHDGIHCCGLLWGVCVCVNVCGCIKVCYMCTYLSTCLPAPTISSPNRYLLYIHHLHIHHHLHVLL